MLAALLLLPVVELAVAIEIGRATGALVVLGALLLIAVAGLLLVRRQGAAAWRSLNRSLRAGEPPSRELADASVLVLAGVLLIVPGFLTDAAAVLLLVPLTRPIARRPLERMFRRAAADRVTLLGAFGPGGLGGNGGLGGPGGLGGFGTPGAAGDGPVPGAGRPRFGGDVVEGEIIDDDPPTPK